MSTFGAFTVVRSTPKWVLGSNGVLTEIAANTPAFEYNTDGTYRGLLVEPAATNLLQRSAEFDNAYWTKSNLNTTGTPAWVNQAVAPDGTTTADKIIEDTSNTRHQTSVTGAFTQNSVFSVFAKASERTIVGIGNSTDAQYAQFDLSAGTVISAGTGTISLGSIQNYGNGWYRVSCLFTHGGVNKSAGIIIYQSSGVNLYTGDGTSGLFIWGAQLETGSFATQYKKTEGSTTAYSAVVAPITDAIPVTGTIIVWNNMVNAYQGGAFANRIFGSENLSTTYLDLLKSLTSQNALAIRNHNNTQVTSADLQWQPANQRKRWFFAMTFNGSTAQVFRGDVQGNFSKVLETTYIPTTAAVRDLYLGHNDTNEAQVGNSYLDILTYDDVLTQDEIEGIFYGNTPIFQQTGYAGDFVDKFRQKVQAEPSSTYVTTLEADVLADWSEDIFGAYDADASAFFSRGFEDGATIENIDFANTQILALKALA